MLTPGAAIYTARSEWALEIIRDPRPSCISRWRWRNDLRELPPGESATINGVLVKRKALTHQAARYLIDARWHNIEDAIAYIENPPPQTVKTELIQLTLPLQETA